MKWIKEKFQNVKVKLMATWKKVKIWVLKVTVAIMALFGVQMAMAQDVTVTCTAPIEYTDNTPILSTETKTFNIYRDDVNIAQVDNVCLYIDSLSPATYKYKVSVTINGIESAKSNEVTKVIEFPTPKAPILNNVD